MRRAFVRRDNEITSTVHKKYIRVGNFLRYLADCNQEVYVKKNTLLIISLFAMVSGWTGAFLLGNSRFPNDYAWLLPALLLGAGVGLSLRNSSGRRTALMLALTAALGLASMSLFSPGKHLFSGTLPGLFDGTSLSGQVVTLRVPASLRTPPFDHPLLLQSLFDIEASLYERFPAGVDDICFSPAGDLFVSLPSLGAIYQRLKSPAPPGKARRLFLHGLENPTGLACLDDRLLVAESSRVASYNYQSKERQILALHLPADGGHLNHRLLETPSGLFVTIGSRCDACEEPNSERGTIQQLKPQQGRVSYAFGLRNIGGLALHPKEGTLWATERSRLYPAPGAADELNLLRPEADYGWPDCDSNSPESRSCSDTELAALVFKNRANPADMIFSQGLDFPEVYRNSLLLILQGDAARQVRPALVRVPFAETEPLPPVPFVGGWDGTTARPQSLTLGPDRALYVGDAVNGAVYRIAWRGGE